MSTPYSRPSTPGGPHNFQGGSLYSWQEGLPIPINSRPMAKEQLSALFPAALSLPYQGEWNHETQSYFIEPRFRGLTDGEVLIERLKEKALGGDLKAMDMIFDRIMGKPKQAVETVSMNMSYSEYLDHLAAQDEQEDLPMTSPYINIPVTPTTPLNEAANDKWGDILDGL